MTDLNKLRSEFEAIKEIQDSIRREQLIFNTKLGCYTKKSGKMCVSANWTNGAWFVFERKAKAQALPEGYCLVPKEIPDSVVSCLENSGFHWGDGTRDHYTPIYSLMVEVASESGAEA
ncbi:putative aB1gp37 [Acinetobacter baumannii 573719]|nr:putative aB1gp37 [Acinetobacter baumannii 573719]